jgi:hypothetical protein
LGSLPDSGSGETMNTVEVVKRSSLPKGLCTELGPEQPAIIAINGTAARPALAILCSLHQPRERKRQCQPMKLE